MKSVCNITGASSSSAASITARAISRLLTLKEGTANLFLRMKLRNSRGLVTNMMKNGVAGVLKQSAVSGNANRAALREFSRLRNTRGITGQSPLPERAKRPCADIPMGRSPGSQIPPSLDLPPSQTTARPDNQRGQDHRTEPRRRLGGIGVRPTPSIRPYAHTPINPSALGPYLLFTTGNSTKLALSPASKTLIELFR